jgi:hypothetical protein
MCFCETNPFVMCENKNRCCRAAAGYDAQMNYYKWVRLAEKCSGGSRGRSLANPNGRDTQSTRNLRMGSGQVRAEEKALLIRTPRPVGSAEGRACARERSLVIVWSGASSQMGLLRKLRKPKK